MSRFNCHMIKQELTNIVKLRALPDSTGPQNLTKTHAVHISVMGVLCNFSAYYYEVITLHSVVSKIKLRRKDFGQTEYAFSIERLVVSPCRNYHGHQIIPDVHILAV